MKQVAYYKGCLASLSAKELDSSTRALAPKVGYELIELDEHGEALLADVLVKAQGRESGISTTTPLVQVIWIEDGLIRRIEGYLSRDDALRKLDLGTGPDP